MSRRRLLLLLGALIVLGGAAAVAFPSVVLRPAFWAAGLVSGQRLLFTAARWEGTAGLALDGVRLRPAHAVEKGASYFTAGRVHVTWSWKWLLKTGRFRSVEFDQPQLFLAKLQDAFPAVAGAPPAGAAADGKESGNPLELVRRLFYRIRIVQGIVWIDSLGTELPPLQLSIGRDAPLEWTTGSLAKVEPGQEELEIATIDGIRFYGPQDPLTPVLDLGTIRIGFTWEGLGRREIDFVSVQRPTVFIGPELFNFTDAFEREQKAAQQKAAAAPAGAAPQWVLHDFVVYGGRLRIIAFGAPGLLMPFSFRTSAHDLRLDRLDDLSLQSSLKIRKQTFDYPEYGVKLTDLYGQIDFSLPPGSGANNLNQVIHMKEATWKGIGIQDGWASVTFDRTGIYGDIGGKAYGGYLKGDYFVRFDAGFPWHAGLYVIDAEVREPVALLAQGNFALEGKTRVDVSVDAHSRTIDRSEAHVSFPAGGKMRIEAVDELAAKLPADGPQWRDAVARNILGSFRDYAFDTGTLALAYGTPKSTAQLNLEGRQGKRNFDLSWTREDAEAGITLPAKAPPKVSVKIDKTTP